MEINKEYLLAQKASLDQQMQKLVNDANAVRGALQVLEAHLLYLAKEAEEKIEEKL